MPEVCSLIWLALVGAVRSRVSLEAENTILRHQLNVLRRQSPKRPTFGMLDRLIFAGLFWPPVDICAALAPCSVTAANGIPENAANGDPCGNIRPCDLGGTSPSTRCLSKSLPDTGCL
jgi:hypothetical protein